MPSKFNRDKKKRQPIYIIPTRFGFAYGALTIFILSLGVMFNNASVLYATGLLVMLGLMCMYQTHLNMSALTLQGFETESGFAEKEVTWKLYFKNESSLTAFSVYVMDSHVDLPARSEVAENLVIKLKQRGKTKIEEVRISSTYPLGLFYCWKVFQVTAEYFTYPSLLPSASLDNLTIKGTQAGFDDFRGHRDYVKGDPPHHVDWKVHARSDKLLLKLFESQSTDSAVIDWNKIPNLEFEEKLKYVATLTHELFQFQKPYSLILPHRVFPMAAGFEHYKQCLEELAVMKSA